MFVLSNQGLRVDSIDVEWNLVSADKVCEPTADLNWLPNTY